MQGAIEGTFYHWHDNGKMAARITMQKGKPHGLSEAWTRQGTLKSRFELSQGNVVKEEFFES